MIFVLGTGYFGPKQAQRLVVPVLQALAPGASAVALRIVHAVLRKLSHAAEYAILALLWVRAFRWRQRVTLDKASWAALAVCLACATVDEIHQAGVPGRHGSVVDVAIDLAGAAIMVVALRTRGTVTHPAGGPVLGRAPPRAARFDASR
jgi:VanZ family protein